MGDMLGWLTSCCPDTSSHASISPHGLVAHFLPRPRPLPQEQKAELLRICSPEDVERLQYHLKAAFGYKPAAGPLPSYAHLGCDPKKDPGCQPQLVQKAPSGVYLKYPNCDPLRDPRCAYEAALSVGAFTLVVLQGYPGCCCKI